MRFDLKRWGASAAVCVAASAGVASTTAWAAQGHSQHHAKHHKKARSSDGGLTGRHVLLISVDGLHQSDLSRCLHDGSCPNLASLVGQGTNFTQASTSRPSDSFPGMLAQVTGGTPKTTGVFYDDSYDRTLHPPAAAPDCASTPPGTETQYAENIDKGASTTTRTIMGPNGDANGYNMIDTTQLPRGGNDCHPVMPNEFLWTNSVFGVAHQAGLPTAWSDKHPAYQIVNGHSTPHAVDDLFTPEINADIVPPSMVDTRGRTLTFPLPNADGKGDFIITDSLADTESYDQIKVDAVLNQIDGKRSTGTAGPGEPAIFGMNFQSVSVAQKNVDPLLCTRAKSYGPPPLCKNGHRPGGYEESPTPGSPGRVVFTPWMEGCTDYANNGAACSGPTPLLPDSNRTPGAINYVDGAVGMLVTELKMKGEYANTQIILSAKHGQSPIYPAELKRIGSAESDALTAAGVPQAFVVDDDASLIWLAQQSQTNQAVQALTSDPGQSSANVERVFSGAALASLFGSPTQNPRTPDLIVQPTQGTIYSTSPKKVAEHGGMEEADTHVALVVVHGQAPGSVTNNEPVQTTQIAPTILRTLGLNPHSLDAVRRDGTSSLFAGGGGDNGD